jgi:hypothetical protein
MVAKSQKMEKHVTIHTSDRNNVPEKMQLVLPGGEQCSQQAAKNASKRKRTENICEVRQHSPISL